MASDCFALLPDLPACCHKLQLKFCILAGWQDKHRGSLNMSFFTYLAILPGNPRCNVASICPTSIPSSRALVAATPRSLPPKRSASIFLLSCKQFISHWPKSAYNQTISTNQWRDMLLSCVFGKKMFMRPYYINLSRGANLFLKHFHD